MKKIAMIPARMGSKRLKKKNLRELDGVPLITRAIRKCKATNCFDEIYVNSESIEFAPIAHDEGVNFYHRPDNLGDDTATSEDFVFDFLNNIDCTWLFQVHSIAPLLSYQEINGFVDFTLNQDYDAVLSCIEDQIEVAYLGTPINFTMEEKTNSQELDPVQRITWSISAWRSSTFLTEKRAGRCATYSGRVGYYSVSSVSGHVIKTAEDLELAEMYIKLGFEK